MKANKQYYVRRIRNIWKRSIT